MMNKNASISACRFVAMCMIVVCHLLQYYENYAAYYLNMGVYMFLIISGYIFGKREAEPWGKFVFKRSRRILISYYIFLVVSVFCIWMFSDNALNIKQALAYGICVQWFVKPIKELHHLWYITCILICYAITPFLYKPFSYIKRLGSLNFLIIFLAAVAVFSSKLLFLVVYVAAFAISVFEKNNEFDYYDFSHLHNKIVLVLSLCGVLMQVACYKMGYRWPTAFFLEQKVVYSYLIIACIRALPLKNMKVFELSDKYSYDIYITHHIWVLGTFSVMNLTSNMIINWILVIILTIISCKILNAITGKLNKLIPDKQNKI